MPAGGSLPGFNLMESKESRGGEKGGMMSGLWEQASGKKVDGDRSREKRGFQLPRLWDTAAEKKKDKENTFSLFGGTGENQKSAIDWGPGGALGVGCGVGVGVGLTGGAGIGATPWSSLRVVFGVGAGCGLGVGYGYGFGMGLRWDKPPEQKSKRVVIEL